MLILTKKQIAAYCILALCLSVLFTNCSPAYKAFAPGGVAGFSSVQPIDPVGPMTPVEQGALEKGVAAYTQHCANCHSDFTTSTKKGFNSTAISTAINGISQMAFLKTLPVQTVEEIGFALTFDGTKPVEPVPVSNKRSWESLVPQSCAPEGVARQIRILDPTQYRDIISDVFGYAADVSSLPTDSRDFYLPNVVSGGSGVSDLLHVENLYSLASKVASHVGTNMATVAPRFSTCDRTLRTCQDEIARLIVSRLFRRKLDLTDEDLNAIMTKFATVSDFTTRTKNIVTAALMMPRFLYVVEYQKGFRAVPLTSDKLRNLDEYELASRLSFMLWNSVPDAELLNRASDKTLLQPAVIKAQVTRMLADSRSQRFMRRFAREWLDLDKLDTLTKDQGRYPAATTTLMKKFKTETEAFVVDMFQRNADFKELFTSNKTFVESTLAAHYGIAGVSGTTYVAASRPQTSLHAGILSHGSIAALTSDNSTDPIHRGIYKYKRLLCGQVGDPPASAGLVDIEGTKFEQLTARSKMTSCMGCHSQFEPIGYVSESLNAIGQFRTADESGNPVGQSVVMNNGTSISTLRDLGLELASNPGVGECLSENLAKFAVAGGFQSTPALRCQAENTTFQAFSKGNTLKAYVESLVESPLFTRKLETP